VRLNNRVERLETQRDAVEQETFRIVVTTPTTLDMERSTCQRMRHPDGLVTEIIDLEGTREGVSDEDLERWVSTFPIESVSYRGRFGESDKP